MTIPNITEVISNSVRGAIIAPPGRKLVVADLSNIEGRVAAWLAGEEQLLRAFRDYDTVIPGEFDAKGKPKRKGVDLYVKAYMAAFNVTDPALVGKDERQIGKVMSLFFIYGGGVGAFITGAATYSIDLQRMAEQVWPTLPAWAVDEARSFLEWKCDQELGKLKKRREKAGREPTQEETAKVRAEAMYGLDEKTFCACDALKRLWRKAHPNIVSYWRELDDTVKEALRNPGVTYTARKLKIRRSGTWLRIGLPSGRELCYPNARLTKEGTIVYAGHDTYTRNWGDVHTHGSKCLENATQAVACDQFYEPLPTIEDAGYAAVLGVHDEWVCETPDSPEYTADRLAEMMCMPLGWNEGLPLAAAGFECYRYRKGD